MFYRFDITLPNMKLGLMIGKVGPKSVVFREKTKRLNDL